MCSKVKTTAFLVKLDIEKTNFNKKKDDLIIFINIRLIGVLNKRIVLNCS
jgi:hypothetical protein